MIRRKKEKAPKEQPLMQDYGILLEPVVTEKSALQGAMGNHVVLKVPRQATKLQIRQSIERIFGVNVVSVNTCNYLGKVKRSSRSASIGRRSSFKKAYITLKEGQSISVVEGL